MDVSIVVGLFASIGLLGYLGYTLARPEKF
jgi:hypothetical protein